MQVDFQSVFFAICSKDHQVVTFSNGENIQFGGGRVLLAHKDGAIEEIDEKEFRLAGAMQLTEVAKGSLSGLYLATGGRYEVVHVDSTSGDVCLRSTVDGKDIEVSRSDFHSCFNIALDNDPVNLEEAREIGNRAIDLVEVKGLIIQSTLDRQNLSILKLENSGLLA